MREILTHPISKDAMWQELEFTIQALEKRGHAKFSVRFGFHWAEEFREKWEEVALSGQELLAEVRQMEESDKGELGLNDLFIRVPEFGVEVHFCNDSDVHLTFEQPNEFTESFYLRWKDRGFTPAEWLKEKDGPPTTKIREN